MAYTDAVQGSIMFFALLIVPIMAFVALDDPMSVWGFATSNNYGPWQDGGNPTYFSLISGVSILAVISNLAWGLGYIGQPHIIVRFMALRSAEDAKAGRRIGITWMVLTMLGATLVAIVGTAFFGQNPQYAVTDTTKYETIFLDMGRILFHPLIGGLILTAVLAAIMSTISSQLLVSSTSLIEDLYLVFNKKTPAERTLIYFSRTAVVVVSVIAGALAVSPRDSILDLVGFAWAGFGAAFGPLVLLSLYWRRLNTAGALAGMITGAVVVYICNI